MTKQELQTYLDSFDTFIETASVSEIEQALFVLMDGIANRTDAQDIVDLLGYYEITVGTDAQGMKPCRKSRPMPNN